MQINFISILEYIGIISFAASGAYVAMGKRMDIFGVLVVATVTALGGGILRDVIMDVGVPIFFRSYVSILLVLMTAAAVMLLGDRLRTLLLIPLFDTLGLAVFAIDTGVKAIQSGYSLTEFAFVSVITAVGGGVLRDLLCQRVPVILRREIYALAALLGTVVLWFLHPYIGLMPAAYLSMGLIVAVRLVCAYFKINLPIAKLKKSKQVNR